MKGKEGWAVKIIKRFYGISGVLDEYKKSQVEHIGNNAFMLMFGYMMIANLLVTLLHLRNQSWRYGFLLAVIYSLQSLSFAVMFCLPQHA